MPHEHVRRSRISIPTCRAGIVVLPLAFVIMGRGCARAHCGRDGMAVARRPRRTTPRTRPLPDGPTSLFRLVVHQIVGVAMGLLSALLAGRFRVGVDKGPRVTVRGRLVYAVAGGMFMGIGAKLARGCTSGQALTGGALLSVGSWAFVLAAFAAGYVAAPLVRRTWT
jgi:uncharacterized membrane protein YedE/YeeE